MPPPLFTNYKHSIYMKCDLFDIGLGKAKTCTPTKPGTGNKLYLFDIDTCFPTRVPVPKDGTNEYTWTEILNGVEDTEDPGIDGNLYCVVLKPNTGHPTGTREQGKFITSKVIECTVDKNIDEFVALDAVIPHFNLGAIISDRAGKYYVYMSADDALLYNSNLDMGAGVSDDAGVTFTLTYTDSFLSTKTLVPAGTNLDQYLASKSA